MNRIGIDLGGTKIEGVLLGAEGNEVARYRVSTDQESGYESILKNIQSLYQKLLASAEPEMVTLGIGTPGAISRRTGLLKNSNTVCLNEKHFKADLEKILGRSFAIQNDANCFAEAEAVRGAGKGKRVVFGVIMGTGCGGGIVIDGKVHEGLQRIAGEWGHMSLDPRGPKCYCGNHGCVETFISGGGLEKLGRERLEESISAKDIFQRYREKDAKVMPVIQIFFDAFGRAMANLISVLDPDIVVLGGGLSQIEELYDEGVQAARKYIFSDGLETPIVKNELGDSAGVLGAALIGI